MNKNYNNNNIVVIKMCRVGSAPPPPPFTPDCLLGGEGGEGGSHTHSLSFVCASITQPNSVMGGYSE